MKRYWNILVAVLVAILKPGSNLVKGRPLAGTEAGKRATGGHHWMDWMCDD